MEVLKLDLPARVPQGTPLLKSYWLNSLQVFMRGRNFHRTTAFATLALPREIKPRTPGQVFEALPLQACCLAECVQGFGLRNARL